MRINSTLFVVWPCWWALGQAETTVTTTFLRGSKIVSTRTVNHRQKESKTGVRKQDIQLVDPQTKNTEKLRKTGSNGETKDDEQEPGQPSFRTAPKNVAPHNEPNSTGKKKGTTHAQKRMKQHHDQHGQKSSSGHHGHRADSHLSHHETHGVHFDGAEAVEKYHETHHEQYEQNEHHEQNKLSSDQTAKDEESYEKRREVKRESHALPTGHDNHFNETLFQVLHEAPFRIYEHAMGHALDEGESFPVFVLPKWNDETGLFSGFSKSATPLLFENRQFLLRWKDIMAASSTGSEELLGFMAEHNFHSNLIIGKTLSEHGNRNFLAFVVSYYQFGTEKTVLIPFAHLDDFFDDTSEKHLLDPETKNLEMEALHDMLEEARANNTGYDHPAFAHTAKRKEQLENLENVHFQKLFQLLVRRTFLFSFGYADCLMSEEPEHLRQCLDDTFYAVVKMETNVRGALDEQVVTELGEINNTFHTQVVESCVTIQGDGTMLASEPCENARGLGAIPSSFSSFSL